MAIIRVSKSPNQFSLVDKTSADDARLSFKAKGIMFYLLTKPDNWTIRVTDLVNRSADGRDSVYSGIKELKEFGYIAVKKVREGGKFIDFEYVLHEAPILVMPLDDNTKETTPSNDSPFTGFPDTVKPDTVKPDTEKPEHSNNDFSNIYSSNNKIINKDDDIGEYIDVVWSQYKDKMTRSTFDMVLKRVMKNDPPHFKSYFMKSILSEIKKEKEPKAKTVATGNKGKIKKPKIDGILPEQQPAERLSSEELEKAKERARKLDEKLNNRAYAGMEEDNKNGF